MTTNTLPAPDRYEQTDSRALRTDEVKAQWLQNVGAGVGAACIVALIAWGMGIDLTAHWRWPLIIGGVVFGLGQVVRAFVDEFRAERRWYKREAEHRIEMEILTAQADAFEEVCKDAIAELQIARSEANRLTNEKYILNAQLQQERNASNPKSKGPVVLWPEEAKRDAYSLMKLWYETRNWPGEVTMGWSRERQATARQLLQAAQIAPGKIYSSLAPEQDFAWAEARMIAYFAE